MEATSVEVRMEVRRTTLVETAMLVGGRLLAGSDEPRVAMMRRVGVEKVVGITVVTTVVVAGRDDVVAVVGRS